MIYDGKVISHDKNINSYRWVIYRKEEVINLVEYYFFNYKPKSKKIIRINLISKFFELKKLKYHLSSPNSVHSKEWNDFINKWYKDFM